MPLFKRPFLRGTTIVAEGCPCGGGHCSRLEPAVSSTGRPWPLLTEAPAALTASTSPPTSNTGVQKCPALIFSSNSFFVLVHWPVSAATCMIPQESKENSKRRVPSPGEKPALSLPCPPFLPCFCFSTSSPLHALAVLLNGSDTTGQKKVKGGGPAPPPPFFGRGYGF